MALTGVLLAGTVLVGAALPGTAPAGTGRTAAGPPLTPVAAAAETGIVVREAWARLVGAAEAGSARNGAVYLTLDNRGSKADRLVRVATPVAAAAELHETRHEGGVVQMRPVEAMEIPAGGSLSMKPGGAHVMLLGVRTPFAPDERIPLTLEFASGARVAVDVPVRGQ